MCQLAKIFPREMVGLNQLILHHILFEPRFDVYHYIEIKLIYMRHELQDQDSEVKYNFFVYFIQDLELLSSKECKRTQQERSSVVKQLIGFVDSTLVSRNFFVRQICLSS